MTVRTLFSFSGTIDRRTYIAVAFAGVLVKNLLDFCLATFVFHRLWTPLNYLVPLGIPIQFGAMSRDDQVFVASILAVSIPFAWVGLAITVKRFRAIDWPPWLVVLFFVPIANIASFAIAAAWPEAEAHDQTEPPPNWLNRVVPSDSLGAAVVAVVVSSVFGIALVEIGTRSNIGYGWGLFAAIPFCQGAIAAFMNGVHKVRGPYESFSVAMLASFLTMAAVLAVAIEGAICIAMAAPIWLALAAIGALFGHCLQNLRPTAGSSAATLIVLLLFSPMVMGAEATIPRQPPTYMVQTAVVINAPPSAVWKHVIAFPELPPPRELIFRVGISYPERARIVGSGVGAVRYCEFSTGSFVEPIFAWEPGKRLAFRVVHNPEPMREMSFYRALKTSHLQGYMISKMGEFRLEALPGGRTKLIGTTWYQHRLWPSAYWALFSDAIIHRIHMRVLTHIKSIAEREVSVSGGKRY